MRGPRVRPIVLAAGGTGGHLFPALALAAELARRGQHVVLMTDARAAASAGAALAGREVHVLRGGGIAGRGVRRAALGAGGLAVGTVQAWRILARLAPVCVVGFGGYPSVPPVLAARLLGRRPRIVLHEQNAVLGRANRVLARCADVLAMGFADTRRLPAGRRRVVVGNPLQPAILARMGEAYVPPAPDGEFRLLVLGGSLGARSLSQRIPAALGLLAPELRARLVVAQQCRAEDLAQVRAAYAGAGIRAELAAFFTDVAPRLADAHLVIARAGAATVSEIAAIGRPAIFLPLPNAIDDHQSANAATLVAIGAAWVAPEASTDVVALAGLIGDLAAQPARLAQAAAQAASAARPGAAAALADLVLENLPAWIGESR